MANKLLEMRHWAIQSSDDKEALLKHKDGHEMRVALKALPRLQQEQIKKIRMDSGGQVPSPAEQIASGFNNAWKLGVSKAKGGEIERAMPSPAQGPAAQIYKDGGDVDSPDDISYPDKPQHLLQQDQQPSTDQSHTINIYTAGAPSQPQQPAQPSQPAQPDQAAAQQPVVTGEEAQSEQVKAYDSYLQAQQANTARIQNYVKDMKSHTDDFNSYIQNNPINPLAYQESQSADQKEGTAIGLLLGGMGGGGHGNVALDFLNKQIDRNVDAQKANAQNRNTVFGAYQHLYEDDIAATNLAKASYIDLLDNKIKRAAVSIGTPQAGQNAQQWLQQSAAEKDRLTQEAAQSVANKQSGQSQFPTSSILKPGARAAFPASQLNPLLEKNYPGISAQYDQAVQTDKSLRQLGNVYGQLSQETNALSGRVHRMGQKLPALTGGAGALVGSLVPGVGTIAGGAAGAALGEGAQAFTNTEANRRYDADKTAVLGFVSSALKGTNVGSGQIQDIVDKTSPESGDGPETLQKKYYDLVEFIRTHTNTSLLGAAHLLNEQ